jgi:hypothetical protein
MASAVLVAFRQLERDDSRDVEALRDTLLELSREYPGSAVVGVNLFLASGDTRGLRQTTAAPPHRRIRSSLFDSLLAYHKRVFPQTAFVRAFGDATWMWTTLNSQRMSTWLAAHRGTEQVREIAELLGPTVESMRRERDLASLQEALLIEREVARSAGRDDDRATEAELLRLGSLLGERDFVLVALSWRIAPMQSEIWARWAEDEISLLEELSRAHTD